MSGPESVALPEPVAWHYQTEFRSGIARQPYEPTHPGPWESLHTRAQVEQVRAEAWEAGRRAERAEVVAWLHRASRHLMYLDPSNYPDEKRYVAAAEQHNYQGAVLRRVADLITEGEHRA